MRLGRAEEAGKGSGLLGPRKHFMGVREGPHLAGPVVLDAFLLSGPQPLSIQWY